MLVLGWWTHESGVEWAAGLGQPAAGHGMRGEEGDDIRNLVPVATVQFKADKLIITLSLYHASCIALIKLQMLKVTVSVSQRRS